MDRAEREKERKTKLTSSRMVLACVAFVNRSSSGSTFGFTTGEASALVVSVELPPVLVDVFRLSSLAFLLSSVFFSSSAAFAFTASASFRIFSLCRRLSSASFSMKEVWASSM